VTGQARFARNEADVEPGTSVSLALTITNVGPVTDSFSLTSTGLAAGWTTIRPAYLTLFGGASDTVEITVTPPRLSSTTAGPTALGIRVIPQSDPNDVEATEITLHVAPTYDRKLTMLQPALRSRRRAVYEVMVENRGNAQASCRMHLLDPTRRVDGDFDPPALGVEPGGSSLVQLKLRASKLQWQRRSRTIEFNVEADQQGAPTASASATFVQATVVPDRLGLRLGGLAVAAAAIVGAWIGVVKPAIDDAAAEAVASIKPAEVVVTSIVPGQPVDSTPQPPDVSPETSTGDPLAFTLPSGVAPGENVPPQTYEVPAGKRLLITDLTMRNPYSDEGTATLLVGSQRFEFNLINYSQGFDWQQSYRTPIQLAGGDTVQFQVTCSVIGQLGAAACSPVATINGTLEDI
jgi:hypothetical protein